jgi:Zn finger protein HypA/HybF involved in hydrogenase expression
MPYKRTYTIDQFYQAIKESFFMTDALRKLELTGGSAQSFKRLLNELNPDTSHWINPHTLKINNLKNIKEIPLEDILVKDSSYVYSSLKEKLIKNKLLEYKCNICSIKSWNNKNIVLQLDHINGIHNDNRIENLRLLCPNCHSQTDSFCGKLKKENLPKCKYCVNSVRDKRAKTCQACYLSGDFTKISWPSDNELNELILNNKIKDVAKMLNVNESSLRWRLKKRNIMISKTKEMIKSFLSMF